MIVRSTRSVVCACLVALLFSALPATAQITTGTVVGTVKDAQGGVVPGATVVLISEARGTKSAPAVTNATGDYVFPNVTADTYTVEVTMDGFKTVQAHGHQGQRRRPRRRSGADARSRAALPKPSPSPPKRRSSRRRAASGRSRSRPSRSRTCRSHRGNFTSLTAFTPGVSRAARRPAARASAAPSQNNIMMDGISAMDTGNNGQMLNMNIESIAEVKVLTQGYQAEYGRSSGLQITAVTKSGTNRFRGSAYDIQTNSDWNANSWVNEKNGDPKPIDKRRHLRATRSAARSASPAATTSCSSSTATSTARPTTPINSGNPIRLRVPTALERAGDFSQTLDNNGALFNLHQGSDDRRCPARAANTAGCFQDGGVLGRIPANRLYPVGHRAPEPLPAAERHAGGGTNYNYEVAAADDRQPDAAAGDPPRLPAVVEAARHRQVLRPARARADHARH